jgi:hypothetical protein
MIGRWDRVGGREWGLCTLTGKWAGNGSARTDAEALMSGVELGEFGNFKASRLRSFKSEATLRERGEAAGLSSLETSPLVHAPSTQHRGTLTIRGVDGASPFSATTHRGHSLWDHAVGVPHVGDPRWHLDDAGDDGGLVRPVRGGAPRSAGIM